MCLSIIFILCFTPHLFGAGPHELAFSASGRSPASVSDSTLWVMLISHVAEHGLWQEPHEDDHVGFDPRSVNTHHAPYVLTPDDIDATTEATRIRTQALGELRLRPTNIIADFGCAFSGGLPPPTGRPAEIEERCGETKPFTSIIFGAPRTCTPENTKTDGGDASGKDEKDASERVRSGKLDQAGKQCVVIRAIELTEYSFYEYDLVVRQRAEAGWSVAKKILITGVAS